MARRPWQIVAASSGALAISVGFGRFSYGLLLPAMERSNLGSFGRAGWIGTFNLGGYLAGVVVVVALVRRVRPTVLLRAGLAGTTVGLAAMAVAPSFPFLAVAMAVMGLASAGVWIPVTGVVATSVLPARRGVAMGFTVAGAGVGMVIADAIATLIGHRFGATSWRAAWAVQATLGLIVLIAASVAIPGHPAPRVEARTGLGSLRSLPDRGAVLVTYGAYGVGYVIYTTYLVAGLERSGGLSPGTAGGVFALLGAGSTFGGVIIGRISDRLGRRTTLLAGQLCLAGCALALPTASLWVAFSSAVAFGVLMNGVGATIVAHLCDAVEASRVPAVFGVMTLAFGAAQCAGPPFGGFLVDATGGFRSVFVASAGAFVLAGLGAWRLRRGPRAESRAAVAIGAAIDVQREV